MNRIPILLLLFYMLIVLPECESQCKPRKNLKRRNCEIMIKKCAPYGIGLKWTGAGCKSKTKRLNDGGCQCSGYCGYNCPGACINDPECFWDVDICKNKVTRDPTYAMPECVELSSVPTISPKTSLPSKAPTRSPSRSPTPPTTWSPTDSPTVPPTGSPTPPSFQPTKSPTRTPTLLPTSSPTQSSPTKSPSVSKPTKGPITSVPTRNPTPQPTRQPTAVNPCALCNPTTAPTPQTCVEYTCINIGSLSITLTWNRDGIISTAIYPPPYPSIQTDVGPHILYYNLGPSTSTALGTLQFDEEYGIGPSNTYWSIGILPKFGTYTVCAATAFFDPLLSPSTPVIVNATIRVGADIRKKLTAVFTSDNFDTPDPRCVSTTGSNSLGGFVGTFNLPF